MIGKLALFGRVGYYSVRWQHGPRRQTSRNTDFCAASRASTCSYRLRLDRMGCRTRCNNHPVIVYIHITAMVARSACTPNEQLKIDVTVFEVGRRFARKV